MACVRPPPGAPVSFVSPSPLVEVMASAAPSPTRCGGKGIHPLGGVWVIRVLSFIEFYRPPGPYGNRAAASHPKDSLDRSAAPTREKKSSRRRRGRIRLQRERQQAPKAPRRVEGQQFGSPSRNVRYGWESGISDEARLATRGILRADEIVRTVRVRASLYARSGKRTVFPPPSDSRTDRRKPPSLRQISRLVRG